MKQTNLPRQHMDRPKRRFGLRPVLGAVAMMAVVGLGVVMINRANGELAGESASRQLTFDLRVNDVSGLQEPWPMVGGLPFPEGELDDAARIRIVDAEGDEVPAQIDVVATWRDGSIRWAHAGINASPQGEYRVEYGPGINRGTHERSLQVRRNEGGSMTIDTGKATYEFLPDRLLPERAAMGEVVVLEGSGDGAYLIDNSGRLARVSGEAAGIETETLKQGPGRVVLRREGWYVTQDGMERVARARMFFYFTEGSPFVRMTHSIIFTEDTNTWWVRDYGLEFRTPDAPESLTFALHEPAPVETLESQGGSAYLETVEEDEVRAFANLFAGPYAGPQRQLKLPFEGDEIYMLQETYPHFLEREFRAVIARAPRGDTAASMPIDVGADNLWIHDWIEEADVAGDWADADFGAYGLTVVTPHLARRFPKEIAFDSDGARVVLWSGRSGRELDFRAVTLVNEYWGTWTERRGRPRGPHNSTLLANVPSNAQGAARTHDVWLLPHTGKLSDQALQARATAASHPPLLQADPGWLCATEAFGIPMHPEDQEQFPETEEALRQHWDHVMHSHNQSLRRTGFIDWGATRTLSHAHRFFRLFPSADYGFRSSAWILYARSGERRYYDLAVQNKQFVGDWRIVHWPAGNKRIGERPSGDATTPMYWGDGSGSSLYSGKTRISLQMDYYLTGDEYGGELMRLVGDAYRKRWADGDFNGDFGHLRTLSVLYTHTWDDTFKKMAREAASRLIDLDNPVGLNDDIRYGVYYKTSKEWVWPLYLYYKATGDEMARTAILRAMDDKFRFFYSSNQTFRLILFAEAYKWTENPAYLDLIHLMVEQPFFSLFGHNFFLGAPAALQVIANADQPIKPFPVLAVTRSEDAGNVVTSDFTGVGVMDHEFIEADILPPILAHKEADKALNLSIFVQVSEDLDENTEPQVVVARHPSDGEGTEIDSVQIVKEQRFKTRNQGRWHPRRWHFYLSLPAETEPGIYEIRFPESETIVVLESDAPEIEIEK